MIRNEAWPLALAALATAGLATAGLAPAARADEPATGVTVFAGRCSVCHQPEAAGIPGSFPPLRAQVSGFAKSPAGRDYLVMVVTTGLMGELHVGGITYRGVIPAQSGLTESEVAAVLSYLASDRGHDSTAPSITAVDVADARSRHPDRTAQATRALRPPSDEP